LRKKTQETGVALLVVEQLANPGVSTQENRLFVVEGWALQLQVSMQEKRIFVVEPLPTRGVSTQESQPLFVEWFQLLGGCWGIIHGQNSNVWWGPSNVLQMHVARLGY
jgi:hypothetical protein